MVLLQKFVFNQYVQRLTNTGNCTLGGGGVFHLRMTTFCCL